MHYDVVLLCLTPDDLTSLSREKSCTLGAVFHCSRLACAGGANMFQLLLYVSNLSFFCLLLCMQTYLKAELHFLACPHNWFTKLKLVAAPVRAKRLRWKTVLKGSCIVLKMCNTPNLTSGNTWHKRVSSSVNRDNFGSNPWQRNVKTSAKITVQSMRKIWVICRHVLYKYSWKLTFLIHIPIFSLCSDVSWNKVWL